MGGSWDCVKKPCEATCDVAGDPHIKTFDGLNYQMYGKCSYVLVDHCHYGEGMKEFEIVVQNKECSDDTLYTSCVRSLVLHLLPSGKQIAFGTMTDDSGRTIPVASINGKKESNTDYGDYSVSYIGDNNVIFQYKINQLKIHWTGHNAYVTVGHQFENQTCGLCGTYNFNKNDDFHTRSDATENSVTAFTQSWVYQSKDIVQDPSKCHTSNWETSEKPCQIYSTKVAYAQTQCSVITDATGPFKDCHELIPPAQYYSMCQDDACKCSECHCHVVAAYAKQCMEMNVMIGNWREKSQYCGELASSSLVPTQ